MYKALLATAGTALGSLLMWLLPYALVPRPREFDGFVYLAAWWCGIPAAALVGLVAGLLVGARLDRVNRRRAQEAEGARPEPAERPGD